MLSIGCGYFDDPVGRRSLERSSFGMFGTKLLNSRAWTVAFGSTKQPKAVHLSRSHQQYVCHSSSAKRRLVFLGTPQVAADVLDKIYSASLSPDASFEIAAVVSQPGRPKGRGNSSKPQPSPVEQLALGHGIAADRILCPVKASESDFLASLQELQPDLCLTAAYGNILPKAFLGIPKHGTLNIHPSLLPKYRGAAPVQRALQDGLTETGVSVAFTVRAMDAGPVVAQAKMAVEPSIQAPELLSQLFDRGTDLLLDHLPAVWSGDAAKMATQQDEAAVTHAAKLSKEEGVLDFRQSALSLHNKVRAFAGWPGTTAVLSIANQGQEPKTETLKIIRTEAVEAPKEAGSRPSIQIQKSSIKILCGSDSTGGVLKVLEVQPAGKKAMNVKAFVNGLSNKTVSLA